MKALFHKKVQKFLQKQKNKELLSLVKANIDLIIVNPEAHELLDHPFRKYSIRSAHFSYQGVQYRIAYTSTEQEIIFLLIDARENFYEKLKRTHS